MSERKGERGRAHEPFFSCCLPCFGETGSHGLELTEQAGWPASDPRDLYLSTLRSQHWGYESVSTPRFCFCFLMWVLGIRPGSCAPKPLYYLPRHTRCSLNDTQLHGFSKPPKSSPGALSELQGGGRTNSLNPWEGDTEIQAVVVYGATLQTVDTPTTWYSATHWLSESQGVAPLHRTQLCGSDT